MKVGVALHAGGAVIGKLIRWQSRSRYSHAALVFERELLHGCGVDERTITGWRKDTEPGMWAVRAWRHLVIEAREFRGVRMTEGLLREVGTEVDLFRVELTAEQYRAVWEFALEQWGKPYDYTMVARFVSRRQEARKSAGKWFCSELVFAALKKAGIELLARTEPWEVSPGLLSKAPRMIYEKTI